MKYFNESEFECPCCGNNLIDDRLMKKLDLARGIARIPFIITSGYRCPIHNKAVGGVENSAHLSGLAADIACNNMSDRLKIISALLFCGFRRVNIKKDFIHVDIDRTKQKGLWIY